MALMSELDIPMGKLEHLALYGVMCDLYVWIRCYVRGHHTCRIYLTFVGLCLHMALHVYTAKAPREAVVVSLCSMLITK